MMEKKGSKGILAILILSIVLCSNGIAEVAIVSQEKLVKEADLIIVGEIKKIEKYDDNVNYAMVRVDEVIKGRCNPFISVRFVYDPNLEADVQDPNLEQEHRVLLYLKPNDKTKNNYSVVGGWSGVGRFYEGKFYHQYLEADFDKYLSKLKEFIKSQPLSIVEQKQEKAIEVANKKATELGYDLDKMITNIDEDNTAWNKYASSGPFWEYNPELKDELRGKQFWAIYYGPNVDNQLGGDLWVFIDKDSYEMITYIRGQ